MTLSCSWPASAANVTVRSFPITRKQIWFTTSGITGFTLPGMMLEPGCIGGKLISFRPQRGPLESKRRSLHIFESFTARRFRADEYITDEPASGVASTRFPASTNGLPEMTRNASTHVCAYPGSVFIPVPIAVAPILTSRKRRAISFRRLTSSSRVTANASNSWPSVIGTASCSCVRPILITLSNSLPLARNASISLLSSLTRSSL